ncbi:MAG: methyltransferase domain-containing protein [Xanthomonadales bacterium]|nr:methyltransferase domain-containing protein [Xanthomonadales bacterium]
MANTIDRVLNREWFYSYELPDGRRTATYHGGSLDAIHDTRWSMLESALAGHFHGEFGGLTAIDLACHQGYFAVKLAMAGFSAVSAVDARQNHVDDSRLITEAYSLSNLNVAQSDIFDLDSTIVGQFDVVLMLGLLYHLENPVGALRIARSLCRNCCVIETQVVPGLSGYVDYGSYQFVRPLKGSFGIIDETDETHGPEASITGICLVPSLDALLWTLHKVGFNQVKLIEPPPDAYEQHLHHKRVMVVASV